MIGPLPRGAMRWLGSRAALPHGFFGLSRRRVLWGSPWGPFSLAPLVC